MLLAYFCRQGNIMIYLLQIDPGASDSGTYLPVALQVVFAVGLVTLLMVLTHLLGPRRKNVR
jgi:NADH-quinone oxidoreductase subunit A